MAYHAVKSPSSAHRWSECSASIGAQRGLRDDGSGAARDGTCCHQMAEEVLTKGADPQGYLGRVMQFWTHESGSSGEDWADQLTDEIGLDFTHQVTVSQEMVDAVVSATAFVLERIALTGGTLLCEQRVPIGHFTGEEGATGSADVIIL